MTNPQRRTPITNKTLTMSVDALIKSVDMHCTGLDGYRAQEVLRPVDAAVREAQRLINIEIEKANLADQERRLSGMKEAIVERKQKIAELERT